LPPKNKVVTPLRTDILIVSLEKALNELR